MRRNMLNYLGNIEFRTLALVTSFALFGAACGGNNATTTEDMGGTSSTDMPATGGDMGGGEEEMTSPVGSAVLKFKPTFGSNFPNQIPASWRTGLGVQNQGDAPVVLMLCDVNDTRCESPVKVVEVKPDKIVQNSFGPDITMSDLPEGEFLAMIFLDSELSRERGLGWSQTPSQTGETAWGGHVSEFDVMMSDPDEDPAAGSNPEPTPVKVTLSADTPVDLGTIRLAHFHERRMDPVPESESGAIAVVTENGLRMIELDSFSVADAGGGYYDYYLVDGQGNDLAAEGSICGMVKGAGDVIYIMYEGGTGAGFAVPFDVKTRQQIGGGNLIQFDGSGTPCQGVYHENKGVGYLYAINIGASGAAVGGSGLWYADLSKGFDEGDIAATYMGRDEDVLLDVGINAIAAYESTLYLSITPDETDNGKAPADSLGNHSVFLGKIGEGGRPSFSSGGEYDFWVAMPTKDGVTRPDGNIACTVSSSDGGTTAGLARASFHDGRELLFVGGCSSIAAYDLGAKERVDLAPDNARTMDLDATLFGHAYTRFATSPDGDILYVLPQYKSQFHFYFQMGLSEDDRQTFNRYMVLPLALDQGDVPALHPDFKGENVDGHEGLTNIGNASTPAEDPGIDVNQGHYKRYIMSWAPSLAGSIDQDLPTGPSITASRKSLWIRASGVSGVSGFSKGSNLMSYSIAEKQAHLWPHNKGSQDWSFYQPWQGANTTESPYGFDLTPETDNYLATYGVLFVE